MAVDSLPDPVAKLLELGEPAYSSDFTWPDYREYGLGPEHISALIQVATDHDLINITDETDARGWAPVHAWRALGQLRVVEATEPLINLFHEVRDNDWMIEEMPDVFALIGPAAFDNLSRYLVDASHPTYSRLVAATCLMQMGLRHPEARDPAIAVLSEQLEAFETNSPGANGVLIANLVELSAIEKVDLIHKVFAEGQVDRFIVGDWRDVQVRLGLRPHTNANIDPAELKSSVQKVPPDPLNGSGENKGQPNQSPSEPRAQTRASTEPRTQPHNRNT